MSTCDFTDCEIEGDCADFHAKESAKFKKRIAELEAELEARVGRKQYTDAEIDDIRKIARYNGELSGWNAARDRIPDPKHFGAFITGEPVTKLTWNTFTDWQREVNSKEGASDE